jgi:hypothetical protein
VSSPFVADALSSRDAATVSVSNFDADSFSVKQLLYVKVKQNAFKADSFAVFKDTASFQQQFLAQLAAIPRLHETDVFKPQSLVFSLHKHNHSKIKGFFFTLCFSLKTSTHDIPKLIIQAQNEMDKHYFSFDLPAYTIGGVVSNSSVKTKVSFAYDLTSLMDTFLLEFQVRIPPVISSTPAKDVAQLFVELLYSSGDSAKTQSFSGLTPQFLLSEIARFEAYCNPLKFIQSEKGIIAPSLLTGQIPLNLDDIDNSDVAICQRLLFAHHFGLDLRPGHHQNYRLLLPVLADLEQLKHKPAIFREIAEGMKKIFERHPIAPENLRSRRRRGESSTSTSASESEPEELFVARCYARNALLKSLDPVIPDLVKDLDFPSLSLVRTVRSKTCDPIIDFPADAIGSKPLCKLFIMNTCKDGASCNFRHELFTTSTLKEIQLRLLQQKIAASSKEVAADMYEYILSKALISIDTASFAAGIFEQILSQALCSDAETIAAEIFDHVLAKAVSSLERNVDYESSVAAEVLDEIVHVVSVSVERSQNPLEGSTFALGRLNERVLAEQLSIEQLRAQFPGYGDDDYDVTNENFDSASLPNAEQCNKATRIPIKGDGDCLFHAFIRAIELLPSTSLIAIRPKISASELRTTIVHFLKANRNEKVLPTFALQNSPVVLTSPETHIRSQRTFRFTIDSRGRKVKCNCSGGVHVSTCNGQLFGEIQVFGVGKRPYTSFDEYLDIMMKPGSYGEDLEIMALASLYNLNFVIWQPSRSLMPLSSYYRAHHKTVIALKNSDGWGHYETLSFSSVPCASAANKVASDANITPAGAKIVAEAGAVPVVKAAAKADAAAVTKAVAVATSSLPFSSVPSASAVHKIASDTDASAATPAVETAADANVAAVAMAVALAKTVAETRFATTPHSELFDHEKNTLISGDPSAGSQTDVSYNPMDLSLIRQWIDLKLHNTRVAFAAQALDFAIFVRASFDYSNQRHLGIMNSIDHMLYTPKVLRDFGNLCLSQCSCTQSQDLAPVGETLSPSCPLQFDMVADSLLTTVSSPLFLEASPNDFSLLSQHFLLRMLQYITSAFRFHFQRSLLRDNGILASVRISLLKLISVIEILAAPARTILENYHEAFSRSTSWILRMLRDFIEISEMAIVDVHDCTLDTQAEVGQAALIVKSMTQSPSRNSQPSEAVAPSQSSQGSDARPLLLSVAIAAHFEKICDELARNAEKAGALAQDRLRTVTPENSMIARLQLQTLQIDLEAFRCFCDNVSAGYLAIASDYAKASSSAEKISECARRIAAALLIADEAASSPKLKRSAASPNSCKEPVLNKSSRSLTSPRPSRPILSKRALAQQQSMTSFFSTISATAHSLKSISSVDDGVALFPDALESSIIALEQQGLCELAANDDMLARRQKRGSKAFRLMAEAHNIQKEQNSDSDISDAVSSAHSSDLEFIGSNESVAEEEDHPRFVQARDEIRNAAHLIAADPKTTAVQIEHLPQGFCSKGHPYDQAISMRKGRSTKCNYCSKRFESGIITCACFSYVCVHCLADGKASGPPPNCPSLTCVGSCSMRWKPIDQTCSAGKHRIPKNERFWMCSQRRCLSIICADCAKLPSHRKAAHPTNPNPAPSNLNSSVDSGDPALKGKPPHDARQ